MPDAGWEPECKSCEGASAYEKRKGMSRCGDAHREEGKREEGVVCDI